MDARAAGFRSLPDEIGSRSELRTLASVLQAVDGTITSMLQVDGPYTIFAPTDSAFYNLGTERFQNTVGNPSLVSDILRYHIVRGSWPLRTLYDGQVLRTLQGEDLRITRRGNAMLINQAQITMGDIRAANGIIHELDGVLLPPTFGAEPPVNIPDLAKRLGLESFLSVLTIADFGILNILRGRGPFTVFAPTDEAWNALEGRTSGLLRRNPQLLRRVLLHHIAPGFYTSESLTDGRRLQTLNGEDLVISRGDNIRVGNAVIIRPDNLATNGAVHVIDSVIIPSFVGAELGGGM